MKKITGFFIGILIIVLILTLLENLFKWGTPVIRFVLNKYSEDNWIEVSKFIGLCISGWLLLWQAILAGIRTEQGNKNVEIANENIKIGNKNIEIQINNAIEERFKNAISLIGSNNAATRLGAIYALDHIAKDTYNKEKSYTKTIFQILCSYIRETTNNDEYKIKFKDKPSVEIQTIIDLLFKSHLNNFNGYIELQADLSFSYLCGANFIIAQCNNAIFFETHCNGAIFKGAKCEYAYFHNAQFDNTDCSNVNFSYAFFGSGKDNIKDKFSCKNAEFKGAIFTGANIGAIIGDKNKFKFAKNYNLVGAYEKLL